MTEQPEPGRFNWEDDDEIEIEVVDEEKEKKEVAFWIGKLREWGIIR